MLDVGVEHPRGAPRAQDDARARRPARRRAPRAVAHERHPRRRERAPGIGIMHVAALARREPEAARGDRARIDRRARRHPRRAHAARPPELPRALRRPRGARGRALDAALEGGPAAGPAHAPRRACAPTRSSVEGTLARAKAHADAEMARLVLRAQPRRADARPAPGRAGAAGGAPARADARLGDARARHAPRGGARRRPAPLAARPRARRRLASARRRPVRRWRRCGASSS